MNETHCFDASDLEIMRRLTIEMVENQITRTGRPTAIISTSALARRIIQTKHSIPIKQVKDHPHLFESMKKLTREFIDYTITEEHSRVYSDSRCYWFYIVDEINNNAICGFLEVERKPSCPDF